MTSNARVFESESLTGGHEQGIGLVFSNGDTTAPSLSSPSGAEGAQSKPKKRFDSSSMALADLPRYLKPIIEKHPRGVMTRDFFDEFHRIHGFRLHVSDFGYNHLREVLAIFPAMVHCKYIDSEKQTYRFFPGPAPQSALEEGSLVLGPPLTEQRPKNEWTGTNKPKTNASEWKSLIEDIKAVVARFPSGIDSSLFHDEFERTHHKPIRAKKFGFLKLAELLNNVPEAVKPVKTGNITLLFPATASVPSDAKKENTSNSSESEEKVAIPQSREEAAQVIAQMSLQEKRSWMAGRLRKLMEGYPEGLPESVFLLEYLSVHKRNFLTEVMALFFDDEVSVERVKSTGRITFFPKRVEKDKASTRSSPSPTSENGEGSKAKLKAKDKDKKDKDKDKKDKEKSKKADKSKSDQEVDQGGKDSKKRRNRKDKRDKANPDQSPSERSVSSSPSIPDTGTPASIASGALAGAPASATVNASKGFPQSKYLSTAVPPILPEPLPYRSSSNKMHQAPSLYYSQNASPSHTSYSPSHLLNSMGPGFRYDGNAGMPQQNQGYAAASDGHTRSADSKYAVLPSPESAQRAAFFGAQIQVLLEESPTGLEVHQLAVEFERRFHSKFPPPELGMKNAVAALSLVPHVASVENVGGYCIVYPANYDMNHAIEPNFLD